MKITKKFSFLSSYMLAVTSLTGCFSGQAQDLPSSEGMYPSEESISISLPASESLAGNTSMLQKDKGSQTESVVASIVGDEILLEELDSRIRFSLFDLEWQKYRIRKQALNAMIQEKLKEKKEQEVSGEFSLPKSEIMLVPPTPPRVSLPSTDRPVKGNADASVFLDVFCSYQSSHCARLQPILEEIERNYGDRVAFRFYDFPQYFHRYARSAANAFRCAEELIPDSDKVWSYQSALYADIAQLNHSRYMIIAEQLGIAKEGFEQCLSYKRHDKAIEQDIGLGTQLGLGNVPVVFINGMYVKGANAADMYRYYIDKELLRQERVLAESERKPEVSQLPVYLVATTVSNLEAESSALIYKIDLESIASFRVGEEIFPMVSIVDIQEDRILINNEGVDEFIRIQASKGHELMGERSDKIPFSDDNSEIELDSDDVVAKDGMPRRTLPVAGEMTLSKQWVDGQLLQQTELEKHFYNADHVVEGVHLIKLKDVDDQRFYTTLGLKSGDVIMRVNDQWVHEAQNPLWSSLQEGENVSLVLMRKGLPYRYDYKIE